MSHTDPELMIAIDTIVHDVMDPCSQAAGAPMSIAEMGLVVAMAVDAGHVNITLRVTGPQCLFAPIFATEVEERVARVQGVFSVSVDVSDQLTWSEEAIEPNARRRLAANRDLSRQNSTVRIRNA